MVVVPLTQPEREIRLRMPKLDVDATDWARVAAGGSLLAAGILLIAGKRKAGLVTAVAGTALAILDQQDAVKSFWHSLPEYIEKTQSVLHKVEDTVSEVAAQRQRLHQIISR